MFDLFSRALRSLQLGWPVCDVAWNMQKCFSFYVYKMLLTLLACEFLGGVQGSRGAFRDLTPGPGFASLSRRPLAKDAGPRPGKAAILDLWLIETLKTI